MAAWIHPCKLDWLKGLIAPNLMVCHPMMWLFSESPEMGLSSGTGPIIIAPCVLALQALESDHLETLQARPDFTAFSRKHGSSFSSLHSYIDSWPSEFTPGQICSSVGGVHMVLHNCVHDRARTFMCHWYSGSKGNSHFSEWCRRSPCGDRPLGLYTGSG